MYNLQRFRYQVRALYRRCLPYDDDRHPTQADVAQAIGLNRAELNKRLNQKQGKRLTDDNVRAIVRVLAEWGAITSRAEALELLGLLDCSPFTAAEWQTPPLSELNTLPAAGSLPKPIRNNLPQLLTSFIGRNQEREQLAHSLAVERLVTILGTGGSGKTRLLTRRCHQPIRQRRPTPPAAQPSPQQCQP